MHIKKRLFKDMKILSTENIINAPVFIWGEDQTHNDSAENLFEKIKALTDAPFNLAAFDVIDWNSQFSPWCAPAVLGKDDFKGKGNETLKFLESEMIPEIKQIFQKNDIYLAGYSLAGLFSLWALHESNLFDGAVCCSSSLWFDKWDEYASSHKIKSPSKIYMSLGDREEKTKNKTMAKVGDRTRKQIEILSMEENAVKFHFEWNEGGHFENPSGRLAKGIAKIIAW